MQVRGVEDPSAAAPPASPADAGIGTRWALTDLIDVRTLQSIQDTFARAFGLPTVIVHPDGSNATDITHRVTFCEDLTRTSSEGGPRCQECELRAMHKAQRNDEPVIFTCWNGLYDCAIPISCKGQTLGYFLCGQILMDAPDLVRYAETAREIEVNPDSYLDALAEVRRVDFGFYEASVQSMHVLAGMIAEQAAAAIDSLAMLEESERARADAARLLGELDAIVDGLRQVGSQADYHANLQTVPDVLQRLIPWDSCVIYLVDADHQELVPAVVRDPYPDQVERFHPRLGQSIPGRVAVSGLGMRLGDVTEDTDFEAIPGVPVEPEAMLAVPMVYRDSVSGVIVLSRFERRTFTEHELAVLSVFCSQASTSIQLAKLGSDNAERLQEERVLSQLLRTISTAAGIEAILAEMARAASELLGADAVVVDAMVSGVLSMKHVGAGLTKQGAQQLLADLADAIAGAAERNTPRQLEWRGHSALVLPISGTHGGGELEVSAVLIHRGERSWDERLARALVTQASLGLEKAHLRERESQQLQEYRELSELGAELAQAPDTDNLESRLLLRTRRVFSGEAAWLATLSDGPDAIAVALLDGSRLHRFTIGLEGPARVATLRLRDEPGCARSVYDTWAQEVFTAIAARSEVTAYIAEPLTVPNGLLGGLFVGWHGDAQRGAGDRARTLGFVASAAAASIARLASYHETDATLRERLADLEGLTQLAQRLTGLRDESPIIEEILSAFQRIGGLDGALYAVRSEKGFRVRRASNLGKQRSEQLLTAYGRSLSEDDGGRLTLPELGKAAIFLSATHGAAHDALFAGIGPQERNPHRDRALQMIARYGSVALENAELHHRQRLAIARLQHQNEQTEQQTVKLERVLSVHETLASAVLEGQGLTSVASSLAGFIGGELTMVTADQRILASWPPGTSIDWRPVVEDGGSHAIQEQDDGEAHLLAAPAVVEYEQLGWVIGRLRKDPDDVDRAAVEYGALLTALELLRERTATEIETRLRGGLLDELFTGEFVDELIGRQALAFGFDLEQPSRVFLSEGVARPLSGVQASVDPERLLTTVMRLAREVSAGSLVVLRGTAVVAVVPEGEEELPFEERLHAALAERFPDLACSVAVGTLCTSAADYRRSFLAARSGLDLLRLQGRDEAVFSFRETTVVTMLLQSTAPEVIVDFIGRYVEPLARYDAQHSSELRRTAEVLFVTNGNREQAARRLHVHVSTLRYRLGRISDLLGVDLNDRSAMLDLEVALAAAQPMAAVSRSVAARPQSPEGQQARASNRQRNA